MLFKLSLRNIKRSIKNYMIYFATLVLGVCIFYVFNSIESQTVMMRVSSIQLEIIDLMNQALNVVSIFVSFVLGFLIVYASSFMMKRRKKEFGTYMTLGMSKRKISTILVLETLFIGVISLVVGLIIGVIASQGMSVLVARTFEADMSGFKFVVSNEAIVKTLIYFAIIYVFVMLLNTFIVGKERLINLLHDEKKSQKNHAKNPIVCVVVFFVAVYLLATAYYRVTAEFNDISSFTDLAKQIVKGIVGTVLCFWSVSGLFMLLAKKFKKFYNKGITAFGVRELGHRINTTVVSGSIICILLFFTICILSCSVAIKNASNAALRENVPAEVCAEIRLYHTGYDPYDYSEKTGFDVKQFEENQMIGIYEADISLGDMFGDNVDMHWEKFYPKYVKVSEYNQLAEFYGHNKIDLDHGQYAILSNYEFVKGVYDKILSSNTELNLMGETFMPCRDKLYEATLFMSPSNANSGVIVLPDDALFFKYVDENAYNTDYCENNTEYEYMEHWYYFVANFGDISEKEKEKRSEYLTSDDYCDKINYVEYDAKNDLYDAEGYIEIHTKKEYYDSTIGLSAMIVFIGLYIGVIFLISSAAILSLKELSEASDSVGKYTVLRKIGVDEKMINRSLFKQILVFFGLPLTLAVIHSVFGIQTGINVLAVFGRTGLTKSIIVAGGMILAIYVLYFVITYMCCKKIIKERG